jgi:hypothetical protein
MERHETPSTVTPRYIACLQKLLSRTGQTLRAIVDAKAGQIAIDESRSAIL